MTEREPAPGDGEVAGGAEVLQDTPHRRIERVGATVRRPAQPWTPAVRALLRHLETVGFRYAPRALGADAVGRETLGYLAGEAGPAGWARIVPDDGLRAFARLLRDYHRAVADFHPAPDLAWCDGSTGRGPRQLVCHGDFGPWNVVWRGGRPVGLLDWDYARPADPRHDIGYALEYAAPARDDAECLRWLAYPKPPDRRRRIEVFAEAYGLDTTEGLVDAIIDAQERTVALVRQLAAAGHQPQADWLADGHLTELTHRTAWTRAHRHLLE
ncbi:aminoglycoside phosphotransferase family protein [Streptomyces sp. DSM 44915]|uniref:Aminoglycoside phosphotransferase family protein n=1 Tax=Streptomyces chisholmiae TaxID=3075540 RepID=A0ABU2JNS6_9ACTN|nr:aminoglycoside phosphotransferase family protein [Streptomyces sp. DSM 44915]MDT0266391.1 aminoglycoside phosphotransferase family protein [Streptomyces sp. DSM 44915]